MNKTVKTILQALGYIIALILGVAGEATDERKNSNRNGFEFLFSIV